MNESEKKNSAEQQDTGVPAVDAGAAAPAEKKPRRRTVKAKVDPVAEAGADSPAVEQADAAEPAEKPKRKRAPRKTAVVDDNATESPVAEVAPQAAQEPEQVAEAAHQVDEVAHEVAAQQDAEEAPAEQRRDNNSRRNNNGRDRQRGGDRREGGRDSRDGHREATRQPQGGDTSYQFADVISGQLDRDEEDEAVAPTKRVLQPQAETPKLHKVLAQAGIGSRLEMEQLILEGRISVNNEPAHIGQRVQYGDQIKVNGKPIRYRIAPPPARVLAYHKPVGEVVTHDDPQNRPTVFRKLPRLQQGKWQSVGRLDLNTEGLLLFTSSGELANKLMHPRFGLEREYAVRVLGALSNDEKERLLAGVQLEDGPASFGSIEDGGGEGANHWYRVTISEGRNREVRRLLESVGHAVSRLIRIRYGAMMLPRGLKRGAWLELDERDIRALMAAAGAGSMIDAQAGGAHNAGTRGGSGGGGQNRGNNNNRGRSGGLRSPLGNGGRGGSRQQGQGRDGGQDGGGGYGSQGGGQRGGGYGQGGQGGGQGRSASGARDQNRGRNNNSGGGNKSGGSSQPDPMKTSVGYIGSDSFSRHRQQQRNTGGRRRDR